MTDVSIFIDGDACPKTVKDILFKAANRTRTLCTLVANHYSKVPPSSFIKYRKVDKGFDKADDLIETLVNAKDLVVTSDLPLAEACLLKKAFALSPRGELFDLGTIKQKLAIRDLNETLRASGIHSGGPSQLSEKDIRQFANHLDRWLSQNRK